MGCFAPRAAIWVLVLVPACAAFEVSPEPDPGVTDVHTSTALQTNQCTIAIQDEFGNDQLARCGGGGGDHTPPGAPQDLTVTAPTCGFLTLSWTRSTDPAGIQLYRVFRDDDDDWATPYTTVTPADAGCATTETCTWNDAIPAQNDLHTYRVAAVDNASAHNVSEQTSTEEAYSASCTGVEGALASSVHGAATVIRGLVVGNGDTYVVGSAGTGASEALVVSRSGTGGWSRTFASATGSSRGNAIAVATDTGGAVTAVYVTGSFHGTVNFGSSGNDLVAGHGGDVDADIVVLKLAPDGSTLAQKGFGSLDSTLACDASSPSAGDDEGTGIAVDSSGVYLTGTFRNDINLGDGCLSVLWPLGGSGAIGEGEAQAASSATIANPNPLGLLAKLHKNSLAPLAGFGSPRRLGDPYDSGSRVIPRGVAVSSNGVTVVGSFAGHADFDTVPGAAAEWTYAVGPADLFVATYSGGNERVWVSTFGSSSEEPDQDATGVACTADGSCFVVGAITSAVDFGGGPRSSDGNKRTVFAAAFDPSGAHRWSTSFLGGGSATGAIANAVATDGNVVALTGFAETPVTFGEVPLATSGVFAATVFAQDGRHAWARSASGAGPYTAVGRAVAIDATAVSIGGEFTGALNLGDEGLECLGCTSGFNAVFE